VKKSYWKILIALLAAGLMTACQAEETDPAQTDNSANTMTPVVNTDAVNNTSKEDSTVFISGTSFSGTRRPAVVSDVQYLPEDAVDSAKSGKVVYSVNNTDAGFVEGTTVQDAGGSTSKVKAVAELGYKFVKWSDGTTDPVRSGDSAEGVYTAIFDYEVLDMPIVIINTDDGDAIKSKTTYESAKISFLGCAEQFVLENLTTEIRGRGNNSWGYPKKSYKFKLAEKENIFGLGNGKERIWVLLANQCDQSLQRNHVAFEYARYFNAVDWQPNSLSVDVYLNGEYIGVYLLSEDIKVSEDRVNVDTSNPDELDIGYLVELSNYASGEVINAAGRSYMVHNDLSEDSDIKRQQKRFIQKYIDDCYDALENGTKEECAELIDLDSLLAIYLVEEVVKNLDSQWDSFYLHKDAGGKLVFGPVWDFDLSLGNANEGAEEYTDVFVGNGRGSGGSFSTWFAVALTRDWFREMVAEKWAEIYSSLCLMPAHIIDEGELGFRSYERNFEKWQIFGTVQNRETRYITSLKTYEEHYKYLAEWLTNRLNWLNDVFTDPAFVSDGREIIMVQWLNQAGGGWWGGNQQSRYGNDLAEDVDNTYDNLNDLYLKMGTVKGPDGFPGEGVENLFDSHKESKYCIEMDGEIEVTFSFARARAIEAYMIRTANDTQENPTRNPDEWAIYGRSSNTAEWELIDEVTNGEEELAPTNHLWYGFEVDKPKEYKYFKIVFKENGTMQLADFRLMGEE